jgi:hypothetical protein
VPTSGLPDRYAGDDVPLSGHEDKHPYDGRPFGGENFGQGTKFVEDLG